MGVFEMLKLYLKTFEVIFLLYPITRLLFVGQKNSVFFNIYPSVSNLTFLLQKEGVS